jgi:diguanylate cyclase (GGDEF)-like protein
MTALHALFTYQELLREFQRYLSAPLSLEETLEAGLGYLMKRFHLDNVGIFWWDKDRHCLQMQYSLFDGILMEGEEEILIQPDGPLRALVTGEGPVIVSLRRPWVAYVPIMSGDEFIGAVRLQRQLPLPRGAVLAGLPPVREPRVERERFYPLLEDIGDILSNKLQEIFREKKHRKKEQYFLAGSDVATAVVEMPRLRDMLESVARSIVRNLGLDRVRVYLIDDTHFVLEGVVGVMVPERILKIDEEKFNMHEENALVKIVRAGRKEVFKDSADGKVVYLPLVVGRETVGLMVADNLLSQQEIDEEQLSAMKTLADQIGMAIVNARQFEDIEQQAITDGLTKLYVYRYFQQRLKEELDRADRYSYSVALIMMDADYFKKLNDSYGHQLGDKVLEFLAQTIRGNIRRIDLAARYGGDEFVLLLPEITEQEAWLMAARLLNALKACGLKSATGEPISVAVTMGAALYPSDARNGRDLIECADQALYWAKKNSRGDICFFRAISKQVEKTA